MTEPKVKGMALVNTRDWCDARLGEGWFTRTCQTIDPTWPDRILPGDWYPVRVNYEMHKLGLELLEGWDSVEDLMAAVAGEIALKDLNGILRAFLWVASPKMFLRTAPKIWETYANFTQPQIVSNEPGRFVLEVKEIPPELVIWVAAAWRGFIPPALELAGGKDPKATILERKPTPGAETWELLYELCYD